jgi:hypothetical protein
MNVGKTIFGVASAVKGIQAIKGDKVEEPTQSIEKRSEVLAKKADILLERGLMTEGGIEGSVLQQGSFAQKRKVF